MHSILQIQINDLYLKMSSKQSSAFSQNLYNHYREYVEFLNDLIITKPYTSILIFIPNLVMIMDLVAKFNSNLIQNLGQSDFSPQAFFTKISYLGVSQAIKEIIIMSQTIKYVVLVHMIILLLAPLLIGLQILIGTFFNSEKVPPIGSYRKSYESSIIHKFIRIFIFLFQYISLPIWTSVGIKLFYLQNNGAENQVFFGAIILILTPIFYILGEYHLLQIIDESCRTQASPQMILSRKNFPNNIIDCILIYGYLIVINTTSGGSSFILAICFYLARLLVAYNFIYYQPNVLKQQYFTLLSGFTAASGLYIAYLCQQVYIVLLIIILLLYLIANIKETISTTQQYKNVIHEEKSVEQLKIDLWQNGTFTYVYRQLIFQSKKNNSHRKQLLIEILKVKCFQLQAKSRGGAKIINSEDLIKFQKMFVNFLANLLVISDMSISILKLLQNKDPKRQIFGKQVKKLVDLINDNKAIIEQMRQINDISHQGASMLKIMFTQFYNDIEFVKNMQHKSKMHVTSLAQKQVKARLFNKKTAAVFINILDQVGKIAKVSKNIPAVLGYSPRDLLGLSINQIIPFSLKSHHDEILIKFIDKYNKKTMRSDPKIQYYSYNKDFHLQEVVVRYNFVMSYFSQFYLSGVFRKVQQENKNVILTDRYGNIQGWTKQLGEVFNFDDFALNQCKYFNVLPLFPSLIKFSQQGNHNLKTVFFRPAKIKDQNLVLVDCTKPNINIMQVKQKQFKTFQKLLINDEIVQAYLADIQYDEVAFCSGRVKMKKIIIRNFQRIQNFTQIQDSIIKSLNGQKKVEAQDDLDEKSQTNKQPSVSEYSMLGEQAGQNKLLDSNFTLDPNAENAFKKDELRLQSEVSKSQLSIDLTDVNHNNQDQALLNDQVNGGVNQQNGDALTQNSFSPKLQTQTNFIPVLIVFALAFIGIIIWDQIVFTSTQNQMNSQCQNVINRNRALMIYAKSVFNTNQTYVRQFDEAKLMQLAPYLSEEYFNYKTSYGDYIKQNKFYMFNIQIPSTLDRILQAPNDTVLAHNRKQIDFNFNSVMMAWIVRFSDSQQYWRNQVSSVSKAFTVRLIVISIGSIAFSLFLIYIYLHYRKQKKMTEAFFKFERADLQGKMVDIRKIIKSLELRVMQWHLQKQFYQVVKKKQITNLQFQLQGNQLQAKIKFDTSQQTEEKQAKKNLYTVLFFIIIFLLTQLVFIILYSVLNYKQISLYTSIPEDLNKACKLIALPNLMLANMFLEVPPSMLSEYNTIQTNVLSEPMQAVPNLFYLLEEAPCSNCTFMYPLLTTNFRSFYSTFAQVVSSKTANNDKNITDLFYAVDVVVAKISSVLQIQSLSFLPATVILYLFSLSVFFISIYFGIRKMIEENQKLQVFLKYFSQQILIKNKHMNGLFNKNN